MTETASEKGLSSDALKARVADRIGADICPLLLLEAERRARRKLDWINSRAGRQYGEDGYGDEYLVILAVEAIREIIFAAEINARSAAIMAARKG